MAGILSVIRRERRVVHGVGTVSVGTPWSGSLPPGKRSMGRRPVDRSFEARRRPRASRANLRI